jgi:hypothetical protein
MITYKSEYQFYLIPGHLKYTCLQNEQKYLLLNFMIFWDTDLCSLVERH